MLVTNWNTCHIHPPATYIRFLLFPDLVNKENHLIPSDEIRATFVVHYHYLQGKKNHRISQKEKLKSPADTSMKMDSAIFPKNLRMVNHPRTLEIHHLTSTSAFQHQLKRKSRQASRNNRFHHLNPILFDPYALWFSLPESIRYERSTRRETTAMLLF